MTWSILVRDPATGALGAAVATRRNDHLYLTAISEALHGTPRQIVEIIIRLVVLGVAFCLVWFGYINYLRGFGSFRLPSGTPIASLYAAIPLAGQVVLDLGAGTGVAGRAAASRWPRAWAARQRRSPAINS